MYVNIYYNLSRSCPSTLSPDAYLIKFNFHPQDMLSDCPNFSRMHLLSMEEINLKRRAPFLTKSLNDDDDSPYTPWYLMALYVFHSKVLKHPSLVKEKRIT